VHEIDIAALDAGERQGTQPDILALHRAGAVGLGDQLAAGAELEVGEGTAPLFSAASLVS